ncbi:MAG: PH domain-containing protein [Pirellulales bacterium]|nr:PH domain-containing protein [Pirellulales bacterium]
MSERRLPQQLERVGRAIYRGVWVVLVDLFRVPDRPPTLPLAAGETCETFQPAPGFLRYLKFQFWLLLVLLGSAAVFTWAAILLAAPLAGLLLAVPAAVVLVGVALLAWLAIHLQFDTTWYVVTDRSLRIRRGIWVIHETTITFENVQNVTVHQGPLERFFGIANVRVDTAGGGGSAGQHKGVDAAGGHRGLIEGISHAQQVRDLILARMRRTRSAGLGDEREPHPAAGWNDRHLAVLREIRDLLAAG